MITQKEEGNAELTAYSDDFRGIQDPYIWQKVFLHTYCHMGQMREGFNKRRGEPEVEEGDINFWITSDTRGDYSELCCDLVFIVAHKLYWATPNHIDRNDPPAKSDSYTAFEEHYAWVKQHCFKPKKIAKGYQRFTWKADPLKSFQPQDEHGNLLNIRPLLVELRVRDQAHFHRTGADFEHPDFEKKRKLQKTAGTKALQFHCGMR